MVDITITPVTNGGFIVRAGCHTYVFASGPALLTELSLWAMNPGQVEREYMKRYTNVLDEAAPYPPGVGAQRRIDSTGPIGYPGDTAKVVSGRDEYEDPATPRRRL